MALMVDAFPNQERGKALGLYMTIIGLGAASGPILGGFIIGAFG